MEAFDETTAHFGTSFIRAIWAVFGWLMARHLVRRGFSRAVRHIHRRSRGLARHRKGVRRSKRHRHQRPEHGDHAENRKPTLEQPLRHGRRLPYLVAHRNLWWVPFRLNRLGDGG